MIVCVVFLAFLLGALVGAWADRELHPKQLPVRIDCAPAAERV